ncbi:MAG: SET domain-containing protein [Chitinophagaceae bacterium]|nr:SET domain-containing protein [Chitinophagaceae bacterium]
MYKGLFVSDAGKKGRGVFTKNAIPADTIIEESPVIVLSPEDRKRIEETDLYYYIFEWGDEVDHGAVGLGYVSMYNHSSPSNCEYVMDYEKKTITVHTIRPIMPGEELTINYSAGWDDWQPVWFDEEE